MTVFILGGCGKTYICHDKSGAVRVWEIKGIASTQSSLMPNQVQRICNITREKGDGKHDSLPR